MEYNRLKIWQPRWHDRTVLLAKNKVAKHNIIEFTKTPSLPGEYYIAGENVIHCPLTSNGKIDCYAVPLNELKKVVSA